MQMMIYAHPICLFSLGTTLAQVHARYLHATYHSPQAVAAATICTNRCTLAETHVLVDVALAAWHRLRHVRSDLTKLALEGTLHALRAVAATAAPIGGVAAGRAPIGPPASTNGNRHALNDSTGRDLTRTLTWVVSVIGRKVPADHERLHGCTVPSQVFCCVRHICAVLPIVDDNLAEEAGTVARGLVEWLRPLTTLAYTCREAPVSHSRLPCCTYR
jgi:hypothetical protein